MLDDFCIPFLDILAYEKTSENENFCALPMARVNSVAAMEMTPFILIKIY